MGVNGWINGFSDEMVLSISIEWVEQEIDFRKGKQKLTNEVYWGISQIQYSFIACNPVITTNYRKLRRVCQYTV